MKNEKVPLSWVISRNAYIFERSEKMKKFIEGSIFTLLLNYCICATILLYKGVEKKCSKSQKQC